MAANVDEFMAWFRAGGEDVAVAGGDKFALRHIGAAEGNGVVAQSDVAAGELLMQVPTSLMLSLGVGPCSRDDYDLRDLCAANPLTAQYPSLALALTLLREVSVGASPEVSALVSTFVQCTAHS